MRFSITLAILCALWGSGANLSAQSAQQQPQRQQSESTQSDDAMQAIQQWMRDNLDDSVLAALDQIDQDRVRDFFTQIQGQFQGTNVYALGSLGSAARQMLPVLDKFEETQPYAAWLRAHIDELDVSEEMRREMTPTNSTAPPPAPTLQLQRAVWVRELEKRPWPARAQTYVPRLKPIFAAEGIPQELVWVAEVESSFDPAACSPAGAVGMFQLMPATARDEQLSLWPFDERYQPEKSAAAAAKFLRALHEHYGNWPLALAAYNTGEGRVDSLLKRHSARSFDDVARWLPAETQMYVPRIEATLRRREGIALADLK